MQAGCYSTPSSATLITSIGADMRVTDLTAERAAAASATSEGTPCRPIVAMCSAFALDMQFANDEYRPALSKAASARSRMGRDRER